MTNRQCAMMALLDTIDLYDDMENGKLPAVSFVKPSGYLDGHPASSKLDLFEGFVKKIVDLTKANKKLWANTAIFITDGRRRRILRFGLRAAARLSSATEPAFR